MSNRRVRITLYFAATMLLSGCASNCNILSGNSSGTCDAMLVGGMIITAPILGPAALLSDAASDAKAKRMAQDWKSSMRARLTENDITAIQECLRECDSSWQYELDYRVRRTLQIGAAQRFVAGDWPQVKPEEYRAYELLAHYTLSWQPESADKDARSVLVPDEVKRSYGLLKDKSIHAPLRKLLKTTNYSKVTNTIFGMKFAADTPVNDVAARGYFDQCPEEIAKIMLGDESFLSQSVACGRAYFYRFRERLPEEVRKGWESG